MGFLYYIFKFINFNFKDRINLNFNQLEEHFEFLKSRSPILWIS